MKKLLILFLLLVMLTGCDTITNQQENMEENNGEIPEFASYYEQLLYENELLDYKATKSHVQNFKTDLEPVYMMYGNIFEAENFDYLEPIFNFVPFSNFQYGQIKDLEPYLPILLDDSDELYISTKDYLLLFFVRDEKTSILYRDLINDESEIMSINPNWGNFMFDHSGYDIADTWLPTYYSNHSGYENYDTFNKDGNLYTSFAKYMDYSEIPEDMQSRYDDNFMNLRASYWVMNDQMAMHIHMSFAKNVLERNGSLSSSLYIRYKYGTVDGYYEEEYIDLDSCQILIGKYKDGIDDEELLLDVLAFLENGLLDLPDEPMDMILNGFK